MVTFRDLKEGDHIYEIFIDLNKLWDNKIEKIVRRTGFYEFSCLYQDGLIYFLYVSDSEMNTSVYRGFNNHIYCTSLQDLFKIIIDVNI